MNSLLKKLSILQLLKKENYGAAEQGTPTIKKILTLNVELGGILRKSVRLSISN